MKIGVIGSGEIGQRLSKQFIAAGNTVVLSNSRGPETLTNVVTKLGDGATAGTVNDAAAQHVVLLAVPWKAVADVMAVTGPWDGQIIIDATNQFYAPSTKGELRGSNQVASFAKGAFIIKAFNALFGRYMDGTQTGNRRVLFFAGDDARPKKIVRRLFLSMGYYPVDLGDLATGNKLMQLGGALSGTHFVRPENETVDMSRVVVAEHPGDTSVFAFGDEVIDQPAANEVKIQQKAIGINYADVLARSGRMSGKFPLVDGFDAAGVVTAVGSNVKRFKVGDRVAYFLKIGAYREVRNMAEDSVVPVPDDVSFAIASTILTKSMTALMAVNKLRLQSSNQDFSVLVLGAAGGVATLAIRLLKSMGIKVIGLVSSEAKRQLALQTGADEVMLYSNVDLYPTILGMTNGKGVDAVIDGVGAAALSVAAPNLKQGGQYVSYGSPSGTVSLGDVEVAAPGQDISFTSGQVGEYIQAAGGNVAAAKHVFDLLAAGVLAADDIHTYEFEDIPRIHAMLEDRQVGGVLAVEL